MNIVKPYHGVSCLPSVRVDDVGCYVGMQDNADEMKIIMADWRKQCQNKTHQK